jgi:hypothetical protein
MPEIFGRSSNTIARVTLAGGVFSLLTLAWMVHAGYWSPWTTRVGVPLDQPVPFSHKHHVGDDGIDCRYCHDSVEKSSFAGIPSTDTCMTCHSHIWTDAPVLAMVRESFVRHERLRWNRVNDLPDFVFFNHSIHVKKGVGCTTCHGQVDQMPLTWKEHSLYMKWCLGCHREPERFVRPTNEVFSMSWRPSQNQVAIGRKLVEQYQIKTAQLTDCSICHR